jgi:hypothetical protein
MESVIAAQSVGPSLTMTQNDSDRAAKIESMVHYLRTANKAMFE